MMINRYNIVFTAIFGCFSAWIIFVFIYINHPTQIFVFNSVRAGTCLSSDWRGTIQIAGMYSNDDYINITRQIAIRLAFLLNTNDNNYYTQNNCYLVYLYTCTNFNLISIQFWNILMPMHIFLPPLQDVTSIVVEANTYHRYDANGILIIWGQIISLAILTIWARGVGPRFRPDQLSELTWKDLLIFLLGILILAITFMH